MAIIDINLELCDTEDLIEALGLKYDCNGPQTRKQIRQFARAILDEHLENELPEINSIIDQMKFDFIIENFHTINQEALEQSIKQLCISNH